MGSLGLPEIAFIFILALLIFGPKKLPEIGRTVGRGVAEFRKATNELKRSINTELALDEIPTPAKLRSLKFDDLIEPEPGVAQPAAPQVEAALPAQPAGETPGLTESPPATAPAPDAVENH
jgi:sec-independent protein translocase protein TatA